LQLAKIMECTWS